MDDDNDDDSQNTPRRQTVDRSKSNPQGIFLHFLDQCPLISCDLILPKSEPLPPFPFLHTSEAEEDVGFTGDDDAESLPLPPPPPPLIVDTKTSPISPTTARFPTMGGTNGTAGGAEDDRHYIGNDSQLPARRKRRKTQGVESLIIHPHLRDTEGAVKDITCFDEAAGRPDDGEAAGYLDDDQAAGGSWRTTAVNEALQQYQELHKVEMRRKEEEHVKQIRRKDEQIQRKDEEIPGKNEEIRRKDEEIYKLQAKVIALHELLQAQSQPRSVGVGHAD